MPKLPFAKDKTSKPKVSAIQEPGGIKSPVIVVLTVLLTFGIFWFSAIPITGQFKLQLALVLFLVWIGHRFIIKNLPAEKKSRHGYISLILFLIFDVSVVAATGRFLSPFFFTLYLMSIILAFIFNPIVSFSFLATLIVLFAFNLGEVDLTYDFLTLLSLLSVVPITLYLRKQYLQLKQRRKEILVLQPEDKKYYENVVDELLSNVITKTVTSLRQPATYIKQAAGMVRNKKTASKATIDQYLSRIITSSEEILAGVKNFEEQATGRKILSSFHTVAPPKTPSTKSKTTLTSAKK